MSKQYKIDGRPSTIFRAIHDESNPYTIIKSAAILNPELSFKAKGILTYFMSRPDGWETTYADLVSRSTDGVVSIRSGIKELKDAGHMRLEIIRDADSGRFAKNLWEVHETPQKSPECMFPVLRVKTCK